MSKPRVPVLLCAALCALLAFGFGPRQTASAFDQSHARWSQVLAACVRKGGFDYAKLKADRAAFDQYLAALHAVTPEELAGWSEKQKLAFWIDAYNAHAVQRVLDAYPLKSIRRLDGGFGMNTAFDKAFIPMRAHNPGGKDADLSLNDVQDGILRKRFRDARVLAALHNTAKSGPALRKEAYTAEKLDAQLDEQMRAFVGDPARNRIDPAAQELRLSEVFKWFQEDFERDGRSVREFVVRYVPAESAELVRQAELRYLPYDWDLDDAKE